jgi:hypothetical protein
MKTKTVPMADRRSFLKLAGAGAAAGGAALVSGDKEVAAAEVKSGETLYRETDHIRRYYELAR